MIAHATLLRRQVGSACGHWLLYYFKHSERKHARGLGG